MKRIALGLQYDGQAWDGYQKQPGGNTVQDQLEQALRRFACAGLATTCAGRTDAGVHALEQVVHFDTELTRPMASWVRGVNTFLPPSIALLWASQTMPELDVDRAGRSLAAPAAAAAATTLGQHATPGQQFDGQFHARFSARARTYHYVLHNSAQRSPLLAGRAGWAFRPLDIDKMREAAACLVGTHDFSAFRASQCQAKTPIKQMHEVSIERRGELIIFTLRAGAFLHHMVRNLVGSLVYVGMGRQRPEWLAEVLAARERHAAAPTFMPDGLYLGHIDYDPKWALPQRAGALMNWM
ncbi:MAG: tRNA pseudouridine synthase A [Pseudomonadota bacterium]